MGFGGTSVAEGIEGEIGEITIQGELVFQLGITDNSQQRFFFAQIIL